MSSPKLPAVVMLGLSLLVTACGGGDSSGGGNTPTAPAPSVPTTIAISGATTPLQSIGATAQLTATVKDQRGNVMTGVSISWASANAAIATVNSSGLVTAVAPGTAQITATSGAINQSVNIQVALVAASVIIVDGNDQSGVVARALATSLEIEIRDALNNLISDHPITFSVTSGGGSVAPETVSTGDDGRASAIWTLGTNTSEDHRATATAGNQSVEFSATPLPDAAAQLSVASGNNQTGLAGEPLATAMGVKVGDQFNNGVPAVDITWTVTPANGTVSAPMSASDEEGIASVSWTLDVHAGAKTLTALSAGLEPVEFVATALPNGIIEGTVTLTGGFLSPPARPLSVQARSTSKAGLNFSSPSRSRPSSATIRPRFVPDELLITFRQSAAAAAGGAMVPPRTAATASDHAEVLGRMAATMEESGRYEVRSVSAVLNTVRVKLLDGEDLESLQAQLQDDPRVERVVKNGLYYLDAATGSRSRNASTRDSAIASTEPLYPLQAWHYQAMRLSQAWKITTGDPSIIVAVVDSGTRFDHPDIAANLTTDGYDFVSAGTTMRFCAGGTVDLAGDGDGPDPDPTQPMDWIVDPNLFCIRDPSTSGGHGLHVAGTIAAADGNGGGIGVAPNVRIRPIRVLGTSGSGTDFDVAQGILYAAGLPADGGTNGQVMAPTAAHVINLSLSGEADGPTSRAAVQAAHQQGSLLIAAAGNDFVSTPNYPAAYPEVMAVSAIGPALSFASYSNWGGHIEVTAPGGDAGFYGAVDFGVISTAWNFASGAPRHDGQDGTSMAAPHVAGVAALLFSQDPSRTSQDVRALLNTYATDLGDPGRDVLYGNGLVDAYSAVTQGQGIPGGAWVQLRDATTGAILEAQSAPGGQFRFTGLDDGDYVLYAGVDEFFDGLVGAPPRWWGARGGSTTPAPITVNGASVQDGSFSFGFPVEAEDNDAMGSADELPLGGYLNAATSPGNDEDFYAVRIPQAGTYTFETQGFRGECGLALGSDTVLELLDSGGMLLDSNDDIDTPNHRHCSRVIATLEPGIYYLRIFSFDGLEGWYLVTAKEGS